MDQSYADRVAAAQQNVAREEPRPFLEAVQEHVAFRERKAALAAELEALVPDRQERAARIRLAEAPFGHEAVAEASDQQKFQEAQLERWSRPGRFEAWMLRTAERLNLPLDETHTERLSGRRGAREFHAGRQDHLSGRIEAGERLRREETSQRSLAADAVRGRGGDPGDEIQKHVRALRTEIRLLDDGAAYARFEGSMDLTKNPHHVPEAVRAVLGDPGAKKQRDGVYEDSAVRVAAFQVKTGETFLSSKFTSGDSLTARMAQEAQRAVGQVTIARELGSGPSFGGR